MASSSKQVLEDTATLKETPAGRRLLEDLARRYYGPLLSFFRKRARNGAEVQDLVQQVFLRLAQYRELTQIRNPEGYIFQTAANALKDHYRHQVTRENFARRRQELAAPEGTDFPPERVLQGRESLSRLVKALHDLPERTRDIAVQRCFEGLTHAEIAHLQGISVRAVEKQVAKALAYLSQALDSGETDLERGADRRTGQHPGSRLV
jgi:RNA polymerase sigma-70 factor (ECF subfamily)